MMAYETAPVKDHSKKSSIRLGAIGGAVFLSAAIGGPLLSLLNNKPAIPAEVAACLNQQPLNSPTTRGFKLWVAPEQLLNGQSILLATDVQVGEENCIARSGDDFCANVNLAFYELRGNKIISYPHTDNLAPEVNRPALDALVHRQVAACMAQNKKG